MFQDLAYGLRMLRRSPGFSILAVLCLTLGIGATSAVFSWIEGVLLRPYPLVADQDRLFVLSGTVPGATKGTDVSWPDFLDFRRNSTLFDSFIAEKIMGTTLSVGGDRAQKIIGGIVSSNYFDALGVHLALGHSFDPVDETGRNAHPDVVIGYALWQDHFHGDPSIIGKTQVLNGLPHTIIGVAPMNFDGTFVGYSFSFWVPVSMQEAFSPGGYMLEDRNARWIEGFARLKPGVTLRQAQLEISAEARRLETEYPNTNRSRGLQLLPLWQSPFNPMETLGPTLEIALAVVSAVLLIACANVGNLLLLRSFARRREMTIRLAVGAGRARLIRQLLTEGLLLSVFGTVLGLIVAYWCRNALAFIFPPRNGILMKLPADLDWRVMALSAGVCVVATILFGLAPALIAGRVNLVDALKTEAGGVVGGHSKAWIRSALVLIQMSLSFALLVGAGLVIQSLTAMRNTDPGFSTNNVLTTSVDFIGDGYDPQRARVVEDEVLDRIQTIGGVESVVFAKTIPFTYLPYSSGTIEVDGYQTQPGEAPTVNYNDVGPGYFHTMGMTLLSGREFTKADDNTSAPVAIVTDRMASQYWPGENPIGRRLQVEGKAMRVVGVVRDSKHSNLLEPSRPFFFVPMRQNAFGQTLEIRTSLTPEALAKALVREIHAIDPNLAPTEIIPMREQINRTASAQTIAVMLLGIFGGLALLLSAVGLYGVMSFSVAQSSREMALRMALGANRSNLMKLVLSSGLRLTAIGVVVGTALSLFMTRMLAYLLYKVSPQDIPTFSGAALVIVLAAGIACAIPAWRAVSTDPNRVLRD